MIRFVPAAGLLLVSAAFTLVAIEAAGPSTAAGPRKELRQAQASPADDKAAAQPAPLAQDGASTSAPDATAAPPPAKDAKKQLPGAKTQADKGTKGARKGAAGGKAEVSAQQKNYNDCLATYDPATNMTRREWAATCRRTIQEFPEIK
jgi:hypothetical protein